MKVLSLFFLYLVFFGGYFCLKSSQSYFLSIGLIYFSLCLDYFFFKKMGIVSKIKLLSKLKANFKMTFVIRQLLIFSVLISSGYFDYPFAYLSIIIMQQVTYVLVQMPLEILPKMNLPYAVRNIKSNARYIRFIKGAHDIKLRLMNFVLLTEIYFIASLFIVSIGGPDLLNIAVLVCTISCMLLVGYSFYIYKRVSVKVRSGEYLEQLFLNLEKQRFHAILHFSGNSQSTYQLNTWLPILEKLDKKTLIVVREKHHASKIINTKLPVIYVKRLLDLEAITFPTIKVAYYVANVGPNLHLLRNFRLKHVFLGHGDSDKASSMNNFSRVYNKIYVAGNAAIKRYRYAGVDVDDKAFEIVGRPQLDCVLENKKVNSEGIYTLLYAPTWEGYFRDSDYSSVLDMSESFINSLSNRHGNFRFVFKPHPLTGSVLPEAKYALERAKSLIREKFLNYEIVEANNKTIFECFNESDAMITDVSSVMSDYLKSDKPIFLTDPKSLGKEELNKKFPVSKSAYIISPNEDLSESLTNVRNDDWLSKNRLKVKRHTLGLESGSAFELLNSSVNKLYCDAVSNSGEFVIDESKELFYKEITSTSFNNGGGSTKGCLWIKSNYGLYKKSYFNPGDIVIIHSVDATKTFVGEKTSENLKPGVYIVHQAEYSTKELDFALRIRELDKPETMNIHVAGNAIEFSVIGQNKEVKFGPGHTKYDIDAIINEQVIFNRSFLAKQQLNTGGSSVGALWLKSEFGVFDQEYIQKYDKIVVKSVSRKGKYNGTHTDNKLTVGDYYVKDVRYCNVNRAYQIFIRHDFQGELCIAKGDVRFYIPEKVGFSSY